MGLMSEAHKHNLNVNRVQLMKNVQCLSRIFELLRQDYTLTGDMLSEIQVATSRDQQVSKLLDVLSRRPDRAFDRFINALVYTHQDDVALLLDGRNARQLIESRDQHVHITSQPLTCNSSAKTVLPSSVSVDQSPLFLVPVNSVLATCVAPLALQPLSLHQLPVVSVEQNRGSHTNTAADASQYSLEDFRNAVVGSRNPLMNVNIRHAVNVDALKLTQRIYSMEHHCRGRAIVISNQYFVKFNLEVREGAQFDEVNICNLFTQLQFDVQLFTNLTASNIVTLLQEERQLQCHGDADAFVLVLLTHGSQGFIFGSDGQRMSIDDITTLFDGVHCPLLRDKPKLFFIQACQGRKRSSRYQSDGPVNIHPADDTIQSLALSEAQLCDEDVRERLAELSLEDTVGFVPALPSVNSQTHEKADMLIAYGTVKGYESWRHSELGSWFVRTLVYVFQHSAHHKHIVDMLTEVALSLANFHMYSSQVQLQPLRCRVPPSTSCSYTFASVAKQYNLVLQRKSGE